MADTMEYQPYDPADKLYYVPPPVETSSIDTLPPKNGIKGWQIVASVLVIGIVIIWISEWNKARNSKKDKT